MDNSINFKGVFIVNKPNVVLRQGIKTAGKLKQDQIYQEFTGKNSVLYKVRDCLDKNVANILIGTPNVKFRYYPNLNNKANFSPENKTQALSILAKVKDTAITTKEKLINIFKQKNHNFLKNNIIRIQERNLKLMSKETLIDFNEKDYRKCIDVQTGMCKIFVEKPNKLTGKTSRHTLIEITPPDKLGNCYAKYTPVSLEESTRRIVINKNGEKIFEYQNPAPKYFKYNSKIAKNYYTEQMQK